jgi:hypothetical protein
MCVQGDAAAEPAAAEPAAAEPEVSEKFRRAFLPCFCVSVGVNHEERPSGSLFVLPQGTLCSFFVVALTGTTGIVGRSTVVVLDVSDDCGVVRVVNFTEAFKTDTDTDQKNFPRN